MRRLQSWARALKRDLLVVYLAIRDPRTPWYARALAAVVLAYALSPIDLIPDFVPILGYLDDLILVPLGLALLIRLVPPEVLADARAMARQTDQPHLPSNRLAALGIVLIWVAAAVWLLGLGRNLIQ